MAEAQFIPGAGAGNISGGLETGMNAGMSLMERKQTMQIRAEQVAMQQQQEARAQLREVILRPALQAKAAADIVEADTNIKGMTLAEESRAAAMTILPTARKEFDEIMTLADPDAREQAGLEWIGKYGHLQNVAMLKDEFAAKKDIVGSLHTEASTLRRLDLTIQGQKEIASIRSEAAVNAAGIRANAPDKIERYQMKLKEARESGDKEAEALYGGLLNKAQASPVGSAAGSEQMFAKLQDAIDGGDPEEIKFWTDRIKALNQRGVRKDPAALGKAIVDALGAGDAPAGGQAPAAPAPAAPAPVTVPGNIKF